MLKGILKKIEFKDDLVFYIESSSVNFRLHKTIEEYWTDKELNALIGNKVKFKVMIWDHTQTNPDFRFRVSKIEL